jgi:DNA mismatch endonuclease (patch repair protein)
MRSASLRLSRQATRDTRPELELRRALHARGFRYRLHVKPISGLRTTVDIVFPSRRVAIFVDGCFWHRCPLHATFPKTNADWWAAKLQRNAQRDAEAGRRLADEGWTVVRVWEHESADDAADRIESLLRP